MAVLAAGEADHHAVALLDHVEVRDRLADLAADALRELADLVVGLAWIAVDADGLSAHEASKCTARSLSSGSTPDRWSAMGKTLARTTTLEDIGARIVVIRGEKVLLDSDLATLYGARTK